ncbi:MAG: hypothetical protein LBC74_06705 [Planctomycetaceae bacterium]|jgi:YD repeat-containing protein|nr:hypothetical protein [Planctomycetaceae bacterium]
MTEYFHNPFGQVVLRIDSRGNSTSFLYDKNGRQVAVKNDGDDVNCCGSGGYGKTFYHEYGQIFATQTPDNKLTIYGYDKLRRQDRIYSGAILELKSNEYKFEGLPVGEMFDIFVTKNDNEPAADGIEKLELDNLTFVKHKTVNTTESTLTGKLTTPSKQIIIVRKQPMQRVEFDFAGRTIASYDVQNNQTLYFHDSLGRQIAVVQPPTGEDKTRLAHENFYDLAGNVIANVVVPFDAVTLKPIENKKRVTRMEHDAIGRVTKIIQPHPTSINTDGAVTQNEYDLIPLLL